MEAIAAVAALVLVVWLALGWHASKMYCAQLEDTLEDAAVHVLELSDQIVELYLAHRTLQGQFEEQLSAKHPAGMMVLKPGLLGEEADDIRA